MQDNYGDKLRFSITFFKNLYLGALSLSCGMWNLHCIMQDLFVAVPDSLIVVYGLCAGLAAPWHVDNSSLTRDLPMSLALQGRFLINGPPGKSLWFSVSNEGTESQNREKMAEPGLRDWSAWPTAPAPWFFGRRCV